jgi:[ribosomal protein S5]-alanine N-acetyltransferase
VLRPNYELRETIDCGVCRLRAWHTQDEAALVEYANDRDIWLNLRDRFPHPYTLEDAQRWLSFAPNHYPYNMAIEVDGRAAGSIGFELHEDVERVGAEVGYWLGRPFWGRGIMSTALRAATLHAFQAFDITRIYATPFAQNAASARVLEKAGYKFEGRMRRAVIKNGVVHDSLLYAITDEDIHALQ